MKKYGFALVLIFGLTTLAHAETSTSDASVSTTTNNDVMATSVSAPAAAVSTDPVVPAAVATPAAATSVAAENGANGENLEFISGEVSETDEANKTITVKLYGETENTPGDKSITVKVEPSTDITDGEKDRDLKSLTKGTEVDVEYDPTSSKATYIFVY